MRTLDQGRLNSHELPRMKEIRDACEILDGIPQGEKLPANTNADLVVLVCAWVARMKPPRSVTQRLDLVKTAMDFSA